MNVTVSILGLVIAVVCAYVCYRIALSKGRQPVGWAILGFVFPLIGLIVIAVLPSKRTLA
jgi:hypothetical protein